MLNEAEEMKDADFPEIRLFHVEHQLAPDDRKRRLRWKVGGL